MLPVRSKREYGRPGALDWSSTEHCIHTEPTSTVHEQHERTARNRKVLAQECVLESLRCLGKLPIEVRRHKRNDDESKRKQCAVTGSEAKDKRGDNYPFDDMCKRAHEFRRDEIDGLEIGNGWPTRP